MKSTSRLAVWLVFIGLVCLTLVSCKLGSFVLQQVTPTAPPTNTPLPTAVPPTETPTLPPANQHASAAAHRGPHGDSPADRYPAADAGAAYRHTVAVAGHGGEQPGADD